MLSPNQEQALMQDRKRELLQAARIHQLYYQAEREQAQLGERLLALLGDLLIAGGQKLKTRRRTGYYYMFETENW